VPNTLPDSESNSCRVGARRVCAKTPPDGEAAEVADDVTDDAAALASLPVEDAARAVPPVKLPRVVRWWLRVGAATADARAAAAAAAWARLRTRLILLRAGRLTLLEKPASSAPLPLGALNAATLASSCRTCREHMQKEKAQHRERSNKTPTAQRAHQCDACDAQDVG
jgi:hypothetical protein